MTIKLDPPDVATMGEVIAVLGEWQDDAAPFQLHPGDLGWQWRYGPDVATATTRVWRRDGTIIAAGELDEQALIRLAISPDVQQDEQVARQLANDLSDPGCGVLEEGKVYVEAPPGALLRDLLAADGWELDESWTPLRRLLTEPVEDPGLRIEVVGPDLVAERTEVHRTAFPRSTFTDDRWHAMAAGPAYDAARCLLGYDDQGEAVAAVTVWWVRPGRPGLIEPMGVHQDHRRHGYGRAITVAAAAALQEMGASSATVCTPTANAAGVATYVAAGFQPLEERRDLRRSAGSAQG